MKLNLSGHHVEITDALREAAEQKFSGIKTRYPDLQDISLILTVERNEQSVEASTIYLGHTVAVNAGNGDMYTALASAASKLNAALGHRKGSCNAGRHRKPEPIPIELPEEEPVYTTAS
ncbi:ribosome-associated translation inhibitor RaiA [Porticoccaceae bacterium LTM1]|nr:ribosome-associated translation inhibitor RaiA [Porticoccaceae bacterium LTM1]